MLREMCEFTECIDAVFKRPILTPWRKSDDNLETGDGATVCLSWHLECTSPPRMAFIPRLILVHLRPANWVFFQMTQFHGILVRVFS